MNILYDNIIFSLQKSGGISVVWAELIKRILLSGNNTSFLEYEKATENSLRKDIHIPEQFIQHKQNALLSLKRYFSPNEKIIENTIFHSSYYRILKHPKVANITYVHDFTYEYYRQGVPKYVHSLQKKHAVENSDLVICISENTRTDLLKTFPKVAKEKTAVIYNGVSDEFLKIDKTSKTENQLPFEPLSYLIYVGDRASKYKNFETLVRLFPKHLNLLIVGGSQPHKGEIDLLNTFLKPEQYKFVGYISNACLNIFYNNAKALVYPSLYEGFGIPILEAQKANCPVIALNCSSIPEVAGAGAILLSELSAQAINVALEKLENSLWRQNLLNAGIKNAEAFSWNSTFSNIINAYTQVWENRFTK